MALDFHLKRVHVQAFDLDDAVAFGDGRLHARLVVRNWVRFAAAQQERRAGLFAHQRAPARAPVGTRHVHGETLLVQIRHTHDAVPLDILRRRARLVVVLLDVTPFEFVRSARLVTHRRFPPRLAVGARHDHVEGPVAVQVVRRGPVARLSL